MNSKLALLLNDCLEIIKRVKKMNESLLIVVNLLSPSCLVTYLNLDLFFAKNDVYCWRTKHFLAAPTPLTAHCNNEPSH